MRSIFDDADYGKHVPSQLKEIVEKYLDKDNKLILDGGIKASIFIYGNVGCGKTRAVYAIKKFLDEKIGSWFTVIHNFTDLMIHTRIKLDENSGPNEYSLEKVMEDKRLLIIDDFGAKQTSGFSLDMLYLIMNYRYEHMLPTIFTSNLDMKGIEREYGERISSRLDRMAISYQLR